MAFYWPMHSTSPFYAILGVSIVAPSACRNPAPKGVTENANGVVANHLDAGGEAGTQPDSGEPIDATAVAVVPSPDAADLAIEHVSSFQGVDWSCDEPVVERRAAGSPWRLWKTGDLPVPPVDGGAEEVEVLEWEGKACTFLDGAHAWVAVIVGFRINRHVFVFRTEDGGESWSVAGLGHDYYTDWPVGPYARMTFRDPLHGQLETLDPPQHHNGHRETRVTYVTRDGGAHWTLQHRTTKCLDQDC
jgi:hypothetical protein